ncbi:MULTISPECIES: hypothetical protein [unclassified Streptomyces]|uniref:hypothetical protein n=1 Tax=unclassified Streptomyces TaxID=2593676 RepID=UPI000DD8994C|nr:MULTISPECIES: hypothetical protein [unclassified Streptomyces]QZZ26560.1 hypothetical protein A7X85_10090 [Streptomyces sp. ST1015]
MQHITDEMPATWVCEIADAITALGHTVADAHESAIVITLTPDSRHVLEAAEGDVLVIGWSERAGVDWGISSDGAHVPAPQPLDVHTPGEIASRVRTLLATGGLSEIPHAMPYVTSPNCTCTEQPCGGIIPDSECPDHGHRINPAMGWHLAGTVSCRTLAAGRES